MKKIIVPLLCILFLLTSCSAGTDNLKSYWNYREYFGISYLTIMHKSLDKETEIGESVLETAQKVFTYVGDEKDADKNVGELYRYYAFVKAPLEVKSSEAKLELITTKITGNRGEMWVEYSRMAAYANEEGGYGGEALCLWKLKKTDGKWIVTGVKETA